MTLKTRIPVKAACLAVVLLLGACGGSDSSDSSATGRLQIVNAILDSPRLSVTLNEGEDDESSINIDFHQATSAQSLDRDSHTIEIVYEDEITNCEEVVVATFELDLLADTLQTLYLHGDLESAQHMLLERPFAEVGETSDDDVISLQVLNISTQDSVEVYFTDTSTNPSNTTPTATLSSGSYTDPSEIVHEDKKLSLRFEGEDDFIFESENIEIEANSRRTVVIHDPVGADNQALPIWIPGTFSVSVKVQHNERFVCACRDGLYDLVFSGVHSSEAYFSVVCHTVLL